MTRRDWRAEAVATVLYVLLFLLGMLGIVWAWRQIAGLLP